MLYITSLKTINQLPETEVEDVIQVFCKESDAIKIPIANQLLSSNAKIEFVSIENRDDMLVYIGELMCREEFCTVLDSSIPIPNRLSKKMKYAKNTRRKILKPKIEKTEHNETLTSEE